MDLNLLAAFVAVVETGSFTAAAARLRSDKSSVSRGVARLERELGAQLLHRTTRKVSPTTAGEALYEKIAPLVAQLRKAAGALPEREEQPAGVLRATAANDVAATFLADVGARFCARYPAVQLEVTATVRAVDLIAEGLDLALRVSTKITDGRLVARRLGAPTLQLFASPTYLARRGAPPGAADLDAHDVVWFLSRRETLRLVGPEGSTAVNPRFRMACDDFLFVRQAVRAGAGVGLLPTFLAREDLAAGTLARVLPRHALPGPPMWLVYSAASPVPRKVLAFRDLVVEVARQWSLA